MPTFPYFELVKKAYNLTLKYRWLWFFGLFIGGTTGINFGGFNYVFSPRINLEFGRLEQYWQKFFAWSSSQPEKFSLFFAALLVAGIILVILSALSKGAVIWATAKFAEPPREGKNSTDSPKISFSRAFRSSQSYLWEIIGLQVIVSLSFLILLLIFATPIVYLFALGAVGKALVLTFLGLGVFFPAALVFRFLHLYGPIFLVVYNARVWAAIQLSFSLLRQKFKESLIFIAILIGFSFLFLLLVLFSIVLFGIPVALLALFLAYEGFWTAVFVLMWGAVAVSICYTIILGAGFAVFQHIAWVLAVMHLVQIRRLPEKAEAFAAEPAV